MCPCSDLAKQYEKKLEQLRREEALILEEDSEQSAEAQPEGHSLPSRDSAPELAAAAAATAVMREAAATSVADHLAVSPMNPQITTSIPALSEIRKCRASQGELSCAYGNSNAGLDTRSVQVCNCYA